MVKAMRFIFQLIQVKCVILISRSRSENATIFLTFRETKTMNDQMFRENSRTLEPRLFLNYRLIMYITQETKTMKIN